MENGTSRLMTSSQSEDKTFCTSTPTECVSHGDGCDFKCTSDKTQGKCTCERNTDPRCGHTKEETGLKSKYKCFLNECKQLKKDFTNIFHNGNEIPDKCSCDTSSPAVRGDVRLDSSTKSENLLIANRSECLNEEISNYLSHLSSTSEDWHYIDESPKEDSSSPVVPEKSIIKAKKEVGIDIVSLCTPTPYSAETSTFGSVSSVKFKFERAYSAPNSPRSPKLTGEGLVSQPAANIPCLSSSSEGFFTPGHLPNDLNTQYFEQDIEMGNIQGSDGKKNKIRGFKSRGKLPSEPNSHGSKNLLSEDASHATSQCASSQYLHHIDESLNIKSISGESANLRFQTKPSSESYSDYHYNDDFPQSTKDNTNDSFNLLSLILSESPGFNLSEEYIDEINNTKESITNEKTSQKNDPSARNTKSEALNIVKSHSEQSTTAGENEMTLGEANFVPAATLNPPSQVGLLTSEHIVLDFDEGSNSCTVPCNECVNSINNHFVQSEELIGVDTNGNNDTLNDSVFVNGELYVNNVTYNIEDGVKSDYNEDSDCTLSDGDELICEEDMPQSSAGTRSAFRLSRHKKLELQPVGVRSATAKSKGIGTRTQSESLTQNGSNGGLRSGRTYSGSDIGTESNVLRKVASLTLDRATVDKKLSKPKFVPEKLDFKIYEKFEGQMLINWFVSTFDEEHAMKNVTGSTELKLLVAQFCTNLLAAGVIRQIEDVNAPIQAIFRPDLMYYWTHTESSVTHPTTPGKLSPTAWPPNYDGIHFPNNQVQIPENGMQLSKNEEAAALTFLNNEENIELQGYQHRIHRLQTEIEKLQTLSDIEELSKNVDPMLPLSSDERKNEDKSTSPLSLIFVNTDTQTEPVDYISNGTYSEQSGGWQTTETLACLIPCTANLSESVPNQKFSEHGKSGVITSPPQQLLHTNRTIINNSAEIQSSASFNRASSSDKDCSVATVINPLHAHIPPPPPPPPLPRGNQPPPPPPPPPVFGKPPLHNQLATSTGPGGPPPPPPPPPVFGNALLKHVGPPAPPPPPPLAGSGTCVPPPPLGGPPPPPPPGGPPPPPPPGGPPPPPPPGQPPPPVFNSISKGPTPFPTPPIGGWNPNSAAIVIPALRKTPIIPRSAMKPLYWTRIQILTSVFENAADDATESTFKQPGEPVWDNLEEVIFDESEFVDLFARNVSAPVKAKTKKDDKVTKTKVIKTLDGKRSQNIGIFITSQHLDIKDVENAVYNFDTTVLDLEILQQVYELRGTGEEVVKITAQESSDGDKKLDKPEQFLLDLSRINLFSDRIFCFMIKATFAADLDVVHARINLLLNTIEKLMESDSVKKILGLTLALGNYMNGGNRQRGQADGFGLEILPKLKDVKSKDSSITLLHFIVSKYITKYEGANAGTDKAKLPIPDPYSVAKSSHIQFEDLQQDLINQEKTLQVCERRSKEVIKASDTDHLHPFQERMTEFIEQARKDLDEENKNLIECKDQFDIVKQYFQFHGKGKDVTPTEFFGVWAPFCNDFMQIWQKEQLKIVKARIKKAEDEVKRIKDDKKEIIRMKIKEEGGLKSKIQARRRP